MLEAGMITRPKTYSVDIQLLNKIFLIRRIDYCKLVISTALQFYDVIHLFGVNLKYQSQIKRSPGCSESHHRNFCKIKVY